MDLWVVGHIKLGSVHLAVLECGYRMVTVTMLVTLVLATLMVVIVRLVDHQAIMGLAVGAVIQVSVQHSVLMFGLAMGTAIQYVIIRIAAMIMGIVSKIVSECRKIDIRMVLLR